MAIGLYIHIPFCIRKCNYCDFVSYPVREVDIASYLDALEQELAFYSRSLAQDDRELETLYVGGGTPTCLSIEELRGILEASRRFFHWLPGLEVTVEANPGTIDLEKLRMLKDAGVNRLSMGVQSFDAQHLIKMGRQHGVHEIGEAMQWARDVGFDNLSLDLIYGLPEQTLEQWLDTLTKALLLEPEHLSTYGLKIEAGTPWGRLEVEGKIEPAHEDLARCMYDEVQARCLEYGYRHYEISNFAKPGYESRHNRRYWLMKPYLGIGAAASSLLGGNRWTNLANLGDYQGALVASRVPVEAQWELDREEQMSETIILGLRLLEGVALKNFRERFGIDLVEKYSEQVEKFSALGLITIQEDYLRLTPLGLPIANLVFEAFV